MMRSGTRVMRRLALLLRGAGAFYLAPATATTTTIEAELGELGRISVYSDRPSLQLGR